MSEQDVINRTTNGPATTTSLLADLGRLPQMSGATVLVHSSLSALGWVCGGPVAVVEALVAAVGPTGTLVMPTHSGPPDPAQWHNPAVPQSWWPTIRAHTPLFDPATTPTRGMGAVVDVFRDRPEVVRSHHPDVSFAAGGPTAQQICGSHSLAYRLGEGSPLARLYEADGWVLLLGVGHSVNSSLHLGEYRASPSSARHIRHGLPLPCADGTAEWREVDDIAIEDSDFEQIGSAFEATHPAEVTTVGIAHTSARLVRQRPLVDFAAEWMREHR